MTKSEAFEIWLETDPIERTAYSGFMAGWEAAKKILEEEKQEKNRKFFGKSK